MIVSCTELPRIKVEEELLHGTPGFAELMVRVKGDVVRRGLHGSRTGGSALPFGLPPRAACSTHCSHPTHPRPEAKLQLQSLNNRWAFWLDSGDLSCLVTPREVIDEAGSSFGV